MSGALPAAVAGFLVGALCMAAFCVWLIWRSHENFRKMFTTPPKGK